MVHGSTYLKTLQWAQLRGKIGNTLGLPQLADKEQGMCMHFQLHHDKCCNPLSTTLSSIQHHHTAVLFGDSHHDQIPVGRVGNMHTLESHVCHT